MKLAGLVIPSLLISLAAAAVCPAGPRWRFIMTCDSRGDILTGVSEQILSEIAQEVLRQDADLLIYPGDLVYGARLSPETFERQLWQWVRVMKPVYEAGIPVYVCRGNHEVGDMWDAEPNQLPNPADNYSLRWLHVFGSDAYPAQKLPDNGPADARHMSYSVVHKNALFLAVDQYGGLNHRLLHQVDQTWLDSQLKANTQPHVFVFGHEPAFRVLHPDCLDDYPAKRDAFWHSLQAAGVRMYFCGHDHFYDHARIDDGDGNPDNDVHQIVAATAGAPGYTWFSYYPGDNRDFDVIPVYHSERYGYILVEIDGLHVTATWMERRSPVLWDPGVYEPGHAWSYTAGAGCRNKPASDLNGDGTVDFADLAIFASEWLTSANPPPAPEN